MNPDVVAYLRCPHCCEGLSAQGTSLRCPHGHAFDVARQGYVNLSTGRSPHTGDSAAMVGDRAEFLAAGHYRPIVAALVRAAVGRYPGGLVLDAGTGTGHYLAAVLDALPTAPGLGLDAAKPALRRAARAHPRAGAALSDLWRPLPLADGAAGLILNVFAPRHAAEFRRVLRPDGALLVVTPAADHLAELVTALGLLRVDPAKTDRLTDQLGRHFAAAATVSHRWPLRLTPLEVRTLVGMGPSAWHLDAAALGAAPTTATASVDLSVWV